MFQSNKIKLAAGFILILAIYASGFYISKKQDLRNFLAFLYQPVVKTTTNTPTRNNISNFKPPPKTSLKIRVTAKNCSSSNSTSTHKVIINEVAWSGIASGKTSEEWIELKNFSGETLSLAGWQLKNNSSSIDVVFSGGDHISKNGFFLLERGGENFLHAATADKFFTGAIKNKGESLRLYDENCNLADYVSTNKNGDWQAGSGEPDYRTAERSDDFSWHSYSGPGTNGIFGTPMADNSSNIVSYATDSNILSATSSLYYMVTLSKSGNGTGIVKTGSQVVCKETCTKYENEFAAGQVIEFSAVPSPNSSFAGWIGDCSGKVNCQITLTGKKKIWAIFIPLLQPASKISDNTASSSSKYDSHYNNIFISEVMAGQKDNSDYDFVELYNPSSKNIDITGWIIKRRSSSGSESYLVSSSRIKNISIAAKKHLLFGRQNGYDGSIKADILWPSSYSLAYKNNTVLLYDAHGNIIDKVSWSEIPPDESYSRNFSDDPDSKVGSPTPQNSSS